MSTKTPLEFLRMAVKNKVKDPFFTFSYEYTLNAL